MYSAYNVANRIPYIENIDFQRIIRIPAQTTCRLHLIINALYNNLIFNVLIIDTSIA